MQIDACLICDSAADYMGKLCILGAFDTIVAPQAPIKHAHSAVVVRIRYQRSEEGKHTFRLMMIDQDGAQVGPRIDGEANVVVPPGRESIVSNLILNMNNLVLPRFGVFHFDLAIDGHQVASMPIHVVPHPQAQMPA